MPELDAPRELTPEEAKALSRLRSTIQRKSYRNRLRTSYVESKKRLDKIGFSVPPTMVDFQTPIGWADKACRVPASRVRPDGFTLPRQSSLLDEVDEIFEDNWFRAVEKMAIESSLEHSVAFMFVTPAAEDEEESTDREVVISARQATEATAEIDERTNRTTLALEMVSRRKALLYFPGRTLRLELLGGGWRVTAEYEGIPGVVPCVPYVWGRSLKRPFGRSRVTRPLMGFIDDGVRTLLRQEVTAEFFSAPQRALLGADEAHFTNAKGERISPLDALLGSLWALPDVYNEDTDELKRPDLKQLQQASMQPHSEQLRTIGLMVASETSMPVHYLGIIHDQPASADAIRAAESDMVAEVEAELPSIDISRTELARIVLAVKHGEFTPGMRRDLRGLRSLFRDPGTATRAAQADAAVKYGQAFPDGDPEVAMEEYGLSRSQIRRNLEHAKRKQAKGRATELFASTRSGGVAPEGQTSVEAAKAEVEVLNLKASALGTLRRAGVKADSAADLAGLDGVEFMPGAPITIRQPEE